MAIKNNEFWQSFIDVLRDLPELWQIKSKDFKNRDKKAKAWNILLQKYKENEAQATIEVVKRKVLSLRSSYRRELNKVKKSERSGTGVGKNYIPTLWYFQELDFLRDQECQIEGNSTVDMETMETIPSDIEIKNEIQTAEKKSKFNRCQKTKLPEGSVEHLNEVNKIKRDRDEADIFSESWAVVFRKMRSDQKIYAKQAIDEILLQGQLGQLKLNFLQSSRPQEQPNTSFFQPVPRTSPTTSCSTPHSFTSEYSCPSQNLNTSTEQQILVSQESSQKFKLEDIPDEIEYQEI